jgi:hypothetical protein
MSQIAPKPPAEPLIKPLLGCPSCGLEMRLFAVEPQSNMRNLYTFECAKCGTLEVRGVLVPATPI